jgi:hypothetical protein
MQLTTDGIDDLRGVRRGSQLNPEGAERGAGSER